MDRLAMDRSRFMLIGDGSIGDGLSGGRGPFDSRQMDPEVLNIYFPGTVKWTPNNLTDPLVWANCFSILCQYFGVHLTDRQMDPNVMTNKSNTIEKTIEA